MVMTEQQMEFARHWSEGRREVYDPEKLTPAECIVEKKLVSDLEQYRPRLSDFNYKKQEIENDQRKIAEMKQRKTGDYRRPRILEANLFYGIEKANWLSEDCRTVLASEYDDWFNGTDFILEFQEGNQITRLAVDVAMEGTEDIEKKRGKIREQLEDGSLTRLKYFASEVDPKTRGKISGIPKVIIGTNADGVRALSETVAKTLQGEKGSNLALAHHGIQLELLMEICNQLSAELEYANLYFSQQRHDPRQKDVKSSIQSALTIIEGILADKKRELADTIPQAQGRMRRVDMGWQQDLEELKKAA